MGELVNFPSAVQTGSDAGDRGIRDAKVSINKEERFVRANERISTEALYSAKEVLSPQLGNVFRLLEEAIKRLDSAMQHFKDGKAMKSDDEINRLRALLPELFCCSALGDGFGATIGAIHHGIVNLGGAPLEELQLIELRKVIRRLQTEPFLSFEEAIDQQIVLEDVGFVVEPKEIDKLADFLND